jgi:hypothetical protein
MKQIIRKTAVFVLPFLFLYVITLLFYGNAISSPDLLRVGYFPVFEEYREVFQKEFDNKVCFYTVSEDKVKKSKILTIGDSFSEQSSFGYKNYLAEKYSVLHVDRFIASNQIQTLYQFLNSGFFEEHKVEYVILENVERGFVANLNEMDTLKMKMKPQLKKQLINQRPVMKKGDKSFFSRETIIFPFSMFRFYVDENYLSNENIYNVTLKTDEFFSNSSNKLLFFLEDVSRLELNNNLTEIKKLNDVLNDLSKKLWSKKVKLIVLPAPDKYDLYYDYIADKTNFPKPLFFQYLGSLKKEYIYIDSKKSLSSKLKSEKDIYFYDDTHWSPVGARIIANEIEGIIK